MASGPLGDDATIYVIARDRANRRIMLGGLGALGVGQAWLDEAPRHAEYRGYAEAEERSEPPEPRLATPAELQALYGLDDAARRARIVADAFAEDRFVIFMERFDVIGGVSFSPRYDEADQFLSWYIVPFMLRSPGVFSHRSWRGDHNYTEILPFTQIRAITLHAATPEKLTALEVKTSELVEAARLTIDADRAAYSKYLRNVNRHLDDEHGGA